MTMHVTDETLLVRNGNMYLLCTMAGCEMEFAADGMYLGQYQQNVIDPDGPNEFYFTAEINDEGQPCVDGKPVEPLTKEEMDMADLREK